MKIGSIIALFFVFVGISCADEMRPAYLELREQAGNTYEVIWKVPARGPDKRLALYVHFPEDCKIVTPATTTHTGSAFVERSTISREGGFSGAEILIEGLSRTATDALIRIENLKGNPIIGRLTSSDPSMVVPEAPTSVEVAKTYTIFGIEHIWAGIDHLLFIGCLLFVAGTWKRILITITGFTVAHSVTLALAALEIVQLPIAPVEATIALSIVFLAVEIARGNEKSLTFRYPIAVSSSFGLLHGFGFASVLQEIGLPQEEVVTALLFFNVGVEIGQVIFAGLLLLLVWGVLWLGQGQKNLNLRSESARRAAAVAAYLIGPIAVFWVIERMIP